MQKALPGILFTSTFLTQNQADEILVIEVAGTLILISFRYLEPALAQLTYIECKPITFTVQDLGRRAGLADEDECLVLCQVAVVLLADDTLQSTELLAHVNGLHAQIVAQVCM